LVTTEIDRASMLGMAYTPDAIGNVMNGASTEPTRGKAPLSCTTLSR